MPGVSELGLELADLVDPVMDLGVGGVLANAADGPAQDLGAAACDARGVGMTRLLSALRPRGASQYVTDPRPEAARVPAVISSRFSGVCDVA